MNPRRPAALSAAALLFTVLAVTTSGAYAEPADGVLERIDFDSGQVTARGSVPLQVVRRPAEARQLKPAATPAPAAKISPALDAGVDAAGTVQVLVTFDDDRTLPDFPDLDPDLPQSAVVNQAALATTESMIEQLKADRAPAYERFGADLARMGGRVLSTRWLVKGLRAEMPRSAIAAVAARPDVRYVEPADAEIAPASFGDGDPANDEYIARGLMGTDPYYSQPHGNERIAILDTGVRKTHTLLSPSDLGRWDVTGSNTYDDDCWGHGTATAAILTGNSNFGPEFRGITAVHVDSIKVFPPGKINGKCRVTTPDITVAGFELAVRLRDTVIVAPLLHVEGENGQVADAADRAFDAGSVVMGCNGNFGPNPHTVTSPGVARKAIGVGAVDVATFQTPTYQSIGPSGDGRFKPDIVAPTRVETASAASDTALAEFDGTSAAVANAGGAAMALHAFLRGPTGSLKPGHVYSGLILSGSNPVNFDNTQGAGKLKLPSGGAYYRPSAPLVVHGGESVNFPIAVTATGCRLTAALWWPETASAGHNDVDLYVVDPSGAMRASSTNTPGVFEMARVNGPIQGGNWTIQIVGGNVTGAQSVYVSAVTCR